MAFLNITPRFSTRSRPDRTLTHVRLVRQLDDLTVQLDFKTGKFIDGSTDPSVGLWYLDIYDAVGTPVVLGLGLSVGVDLLYPYRYRDGVPPGKLFVSPESDVGYVDPVLDSFVQGTHSIWYEEAG